MRSLHTEAHVGLEKVSQLLRHLVSSIEDSACSAEKMNELPSLSDCEEGVFHHLLRLVYDSFLPFCCSDNSMAKFSAEAHLRRTPTPKAGEHDWTAAQVRFMTGASALLTAWLLQHATISREDEGALLRRPATEGGGGCDRFSWWWHPPRSSCMKATATSFYWVQLVLLTVETPSFTFSERAQTSYPSRETPSFTAWYYWLVNACFGVALNDEKTLSSTHKEESKPHDHSSSANADWEALDLVHCYLEHIFRLGDGDSAAESEEESSSIRTHHAFTRHVPLSGEYLKELFEAKALLCYQAAVTYSLSAVEQVMSGLQLQRSGTDRDARSEAAQRTLLRCAFAWSSPRVFHCLIHASDAARIVASQWHSDAAAMWCVNLLRPALLGVFPERVPSSECGKTPALLELHMAVELCGNPLRLRPVGSATLSSSPSTAPPPIGVVASDSIAEGTCIAKESSFSFWQRQTSSMTSSVNVASPQGSSEATSQKPSPSNQFMSDILELIREAESSLVEQLFNGSLFSHDDEECCGPCLLGASCRADSSYAVPKYLRLLALLFPTDSTTTQDSVGEGGAYHFTADGRPMQLTEVDVAQAALTYFSAVPHRSIALRDIDVFKIGLETFDTEDVHLPHGGTAVLGKNWWASAGPHDGGRGAYFLTHFFGHSCSPNVLLVFSTQPSADRATHQEGVATRLYTGEVAAVALKEISPGEELTVSYLCPSPLLTRDEKREQLGFVCCCSMCEGKAALLEGVLCPDCGELQYEAPPAPERSALPPLYEDSKRCSHLDECSLRTGNTKAMIADCTERFRKALNMSYDQLTNELQPPASSSIHEPADRKEPSPEQRCSAAYRSFLRRRLQLDTICEHIVPTAHAWRLRLRQEALAASTLLPHLSAEEYQGLLPMTSSLLEDVELLLPPNHPLLTGLRMALAFLLSRRLTATKKWAAQGGSASLAVGSCGVTHAKESALQQPYAIDPLLRSCLIRSFQEHYVQQEAWKMRGGACSTADESELLESFLQRFPVELRSCGVDGPESFTLLSLMEEQALDQDEVVSPGCHATKVENCMGMDFVQEGSPRLPGDSFIPDYEDENPQCP